MLDANLFYEPLTGGAVTVTGPSTNIIDHLVAQGVGSGIGGPLEVHVRVVQTFIAAGAATLQIALQTSLDTISWFDILFSPVYAKADLVANAGIFQYKFPVSQRNAASPGRYSRIQYTVATGPFTAGKLASWLNAMGDRESTFQYPSNFPL